MAALLTVLLACSAFAVVEPPPRDVLPQVCAYTAHDLRLHARFEQLVGRSVDCAVVFNDTAPTWAGWADPWFTRALPGQPQFRWSQWVRGGAGVRSLVITQSLVPSSVPADWRARGARGEYDAHAVQLARTLVERGLASAVVRLGHEANGDWYLDAVGETPAQRRDWAAYWARVVRAMRAVPGAEFRFDWTVNPGYRPVPWSAFYPGDDVVDIIGVDQYDVAPLGPSAVSRWNRLMNRPAGLGSVVAFARAHKKPLSLPETGLVAVSSPQGGGDDPAYIDGLAAVVRGYPTAYIGYFDKNVGDTLRLAQVPRSLARWRYHFGESGDSARGAAR